LGNKHDGKSTKLTFDFSIPPFTLNIWNESGHPYNEQYAEDYGKIAMHAVPAEEGYAQTGKCGSTVDCDPVLCINIIEL
jgi:hypothetical protein